MTQRTPIEMTRVLIDGPNIDMVLGGEILSRKPRYFERPRWDRFRYAVSTFIASERPTFVLNGRNFNRDNVFGFARFLKAQGFDVQAPRAGVGDPVDQYIQAVIKESMCSGSCTAIAVVSHDHGFANDLQEALQAGIAVTIIGFREYFSPSLVSLSSKGAALVDIEHDIGAFDVKLPRLFQSASC